MKIIKEKREINLKKIKKNKYYIYLALAIIVFAKDNILQFLIDDFY